MRFAVIGAGGVGGYFGALLAAGGHDVVFVARGRHLEAIRARGLTIRSDHTPVHLDQVQVAERISAIGTADVILLAVKLWDTEEVAQQLGPLTEDGTAVMSLQNGVQKDEILQRYATAGSILGAACYISAAIEEPGVIRHNGALARVFLGEYDGSTSARVTAIRDALTGAGIQTDVSPDIQRVLWEKFIFLVGLSAVTSATRQPIGVVRRDTATRDLLRAVMVETVEVGRVYGVAVPEDFADGQVAFCDTLPDQMSSSMLHDLMHGHRLELPWLSGGVATMADGLGLEVPYNRALAAVLSPYVYGTPPTPALP
jgi:2-dehydropantoate 2-reductase